MDGGPDTRRVEVLMAKNMNLRKLDENIIENVRVSGVPQIQSAQKKLLGSGVK